MFIPKENLTQEDRSLADKTCRVLRSCMTSDHFRCAARYAELAARRAGHSDVRKYAENANQTARLVSRLIPNGSAA